MQKLFEYNWQVRNDWFDWCSQVNEEELLKKRTGGIGGILYTLYHIVDVEYCWISQMQGKTPEITPFEECDSLDKLRAYSEECHKGIAPFIYAWNSDLEMKVLTDWDVTGEKEFFKYGEVMRHVIAHEIHHIGQLSIWSREIGIRPVTANLIRRGLFD